MTQTNTQKKNIVTFLTYSKLKLFMYLFCQFLTYLVNQNKSINKFRSETVKSVCYSSVYQRGQLFIITN